MTDYLEELDPVVQSVANEIARKFWRYGVEREDVAQELRIWLYRHTTKLDEWMAEDHGEKMVATTLRNEGRAWAVRQKADYLGYSVSDLTWYARKELQKVLLPGVYDPEAWNEPPVSDDASRNRRDPATGGNWVAMLADVSRGVAQLPADDRDLLHMFYGDGMTNVLVAEMLGVTPQAASQKHQRVLGRLVEVLGGERPRNTHDEPVCECEPQYVGQRKTMSNAAARAQQDNYYEETA